MFLRNVLLFIIMILSVINLSFAQQGKVQTGLDRIFSYSDYFKNKRVGIICNHTAVNRKGEYIVDIFRRMENVQISALFGPEHGIKGKHDAGEKVDSGRAETIPVYSLYGKVRKPTPQMLANVDILVFDIQDIGARFYTYIWTMALAMEAAAEKGIPFVVLDRPNPINGLKVEGPILDRKFSSFVGMFPIPVRHGMTTGELAMMFNGEGWLKNGIKVDLKIIPLSGWKRQYWFDQTGLPFIKPSPNMPDLETAIVYPGMCLLEGTNISEGRGTLQPFIKFGAPWINGKKLAQKLNASKLPGVRFTAVQFRPLAIKGMSSDPKYRNRICNGVKILLADREVFEPFRSGLKVVETLHKLYPDSLQWRNSHFDRLCGSDIARRTIQSGEDLESLFKEWQVELEKFKSLRARYLLY